MDEFYEIDAAQAHQLLAEMQFADSKMSLYKLRVYVDNEGVKFKVNEFTWSPSYGKKVKGS